MTSEKKVVVIVILTTRMKRLHDGFLIVMKRWNVT